MRISMQIGDQSLEQLRTEIQQLTASFEQKNGAVQTAPIITRSIHRAEFNGKRVNVKTIQKASNNVAISGKRSEAKSARLLC